MRFFLIPLVFALVSAFPRVVYAQTCSLPANYKNVVSELAESIEVTLATEWDTYSVADSIACYLIFENVGDTTYVIPNPSAISPLYTIWILPDTCDSRIGCSFDALMISPGFVFFFGVPIVLEPGECVSYQVTWDGIPRGGGITPPGNYIVFGGMSTGSSIFFPDGGTRLSITIQDLVPRWPTTWTKIKARYGN